MEPFGVVAGRHQERGSRVGSNPEEAEQIGGSRQKQRLDLVVQFDEPPDRDSERDEPTKTAMPWWRRSPDRPIEWNAASPLRSRER